MTEKDKKIKELEYMIERYKNVVKDLAYVNIQLQKQLNLIDVGSTCCDKVPSDSYYLGTTCLKCNKPFRQINK